MEERARAALPRVHPRAVRARNQLQPFPFGTDLTPEEVVLAKALQGLKRIKDLLKRAVVYALASVEAI